MNWRVMRKRMERRGVLMDEVCVCRRDEMI